jgi:hypothetical protein
LPDTELRLHRGRGQSDLATYPRGTAGDPDTSDRTLDGIGSDDIVTADQVANRCARNTGVSGCTEAFSGSGDRRTVDDARSWGHAAHCRAGRRQSPSPPFR